MTPGPEAAALPALPLVVQIGFSGSRRLFDAEGDDDRFAEELSGRLVALLQALRQRLALTPQHFCVGISQLAVGGDVCFTAALARLGWGQRLFLPQPREEFLAATGAGGAPDFTNPQRAQVRPLFEGRHIIEETVVSTAADRDGRFEETAVQILLEADVMVCLRRAGAPDLRGGTVEMGRRAQARGKPLLDVEVALGADGALELAVSWLGFEGFEPPSLPAALQSLAPPLRLADDGAPPSVEDYAARLKAHGSQRADQRRRTFASAAWVIIGTHVGATVLAAAALKVPSPPIVLAMIVVEVLLLLLGLARHLRLHHDGTTFDWALTRLCAEIARSVSAFAPLPRPLHHLLVLPLPAGLRPLLRTVNVLHLGSHQRRGALPWQALQQQYLQSRLRDPQRGQLPYYAARSASAGRRFEWAGRLFTAFSAATLAAIAAKLAIKAWAPDLELWHALESAAGVLGVVLPVLAVAVMSLAAAHDLDARANIFDEMHRFLARQERDIAAASSLPELALLVAETEARLLGETLNWFARRAYINVA